MLRSLEHKKPIILSFMMGSIQISEIPEKIIYLITDKRNIIFRISHLLCIISHTSTSKWGFANRSFFGFFFFFTMNFHYRVGIQKRKYFSESCGMFFGSSRLWQIQLPINFPSGTGQHFRDNLQDTSIFYLHNSILHDRIIQINFVLPDIRTASTFQCYNAALMGWKLLKGSF